MLQLRNNTRLATPGISVFQNKDGVDTLYVVLKATFDINPRPGLSTEQPPICQEDIYWGKPGESSLRYAADTHIGKSSTDIILLGHAYAPDHQPTRYCDVGLQVGHQQMKIEVFGDRQWQDGEITPPEPFLTMPLTYENAYGGCHTYEKMNEDGTFETYTEAEENNPVGKGFIGKRKKEETDGLALPNLEDPQQLIHTQQDTPAPVAFGYIAPNWLPRRQFAGTYDEHWRKTQAPYLPTDFDHRFFGMSHQQINDGRFLQGGEPVSVINASPDGALHFSVPHCPLAVVVNKNDELHNLPLFYDTVLIEPDANRFAVIWRASLSCDKEMLKIKAIDVNYKKARQPKGAT